MTEMSSLRFNQALKMLGFSEDEIKILSYLFLKGKGTAQEISRETAISFSTAHYVLSSLARRDLIKGTPGEEEIFEIPSKEGFFQWVDEQKKANEAIYEKAKLDIHSFLTAREEESWKPEIQYYEGKEGILEIYEDLVTTGADVHSWLDIKRIYKAIGDHLYTYIEDRQKRGIESNSIMPENEMNISHDHKHEKRSAKIVEGLDINGEIRIYGDKVAIITFDGEKPVGIVLKGDIISNLFMGIFKTNWDKL